jgi:hypothetical protein
VTDIVVGWEQSDIKVEVAQYDIHVDLPSYNADIEVTTTGPMGPRGLPGPAYGGPKITVSTTAPSDPDVGDVWIDTN